MLLTRSFGGVTFTKHVRSSRGTVSAQDLWAFEVEAADKLGTLGVRTGAAFKHMRKSIGVRATELAEGLGVSATTISRWECDPELLPTKMAFTVLAMMVHDAAGHETGIWKPLDALREPPKLPREIKL